MKSRHQGFTGFRSRLAVLTAVALGLGITATSQAAVVFDNISNTENAVSGAAITATSSTPNTFMGDGYNLRAGTLDITGFDIFPYNNTGTSYTGLQISIYVWGTVNGGTTSASNPAFSNLLNTYTLTSAGNFVTGSYFSFENATPGSAPGITLTTPLVIPSTTVGITVAYQGTTNGTTYASANNLTSILSYGTAPTVGSQATGAGNGYYRNANSEVNGNFTSTVRTLTGITNAGVAMRVYGDVAAVPEPSSIALMGASGLVLLVGMQRLRWQKA